MIQENGKIETLKRLLTEEKRLQIAISKAESINKALDIESDLIDTQSMLRWLKENNI